ncbi:MAG: multifunctional oxoglutarate decarboxylase/oxoglutarate dehydrogenase thiamine, partial [Friedmanniella sp.]|nr:multifunctional oxoglutarate decarboxylase/oxoglutarate dehydrogenase thiamine [Friedmanniella sp.]
MAIAPDHSPETTPSEDSDFGANDWLLEEMYERFSADPSSVDPSWADYFAAHGEPGSAAAPAPAQQAQRAQQAVKPAPAQAPAA